MAHRTPSFSQASILSKLAFERLQPSAKSRLSQSFKSPETSLNFKSPTKPDPTDETELTLSETCEKQFHGLYNVTNTEEFSICLKDNVSLLSSRLASIPYEAVWPQSGRWCCSCNWTLQHPNNKSCCCGASREDQLTEQFHEGIGTVGLKPIEETNSVQFDLQLAITGLLTLSLNVLRDRLAGSK